MVIKYKYSGLLLLKVIHIHSRLLFIWFFLGHKGGDAAHPFTLIIDSIILFHTVSFWFSNFLLPVKTVGKKDYLSIKGDHICFYDCSRRKYAEVTADEAG